MGKQAERGRSGGPEDEVRTEVHAERLEVVLPDRLVHAEQREDDVPEPPDRGAERRPVPELGLAPGAKEQPVRTAGAEAEPPVRGVVEEARVLRRRIDRVSRI